MACFERVAIVPEYAFELHTAYSIPLYSSKVPHIFLSLHVSLLAYRPLAGILTYFKVSLGVGFMFVVSIHCMGLRSIFGVHSRPRVVSGNLKMKGTLIR